MAKEVNIQGLERLHAQSQNFMAKAQHCAENITRAINTLSNPAILDGLRGGQGDAAVEAILAGKASVEELVNSLNETSRLLDEKITSAIQLRQDKNGFADARAKAKATGGNMAVRKS